MIKLLNMFNYYVFNIFLAIFIIIFRYLFFMWAWACAHFLFLYIQESEKATEAAFSERERIRCLFQRCSSERTIHYTTAR